MKKKQSFLDTTFSYRLELMRQIYNTAESPQMAIFQLLDMMPSVGKCEASALPSAQTATLKFENTNGQSSCKNPSRLSLANLMPSRSENDKKWNLWFSYSFSLFAKLFFIYFKSASVCLRIICLNEDLKEGRSFWLKGEKSWTIQWTSQLKAYERQLH